MKSTIIDEIDSITNSFKDQFSNLDIVNLNWKPSPTKWGITQNIEHLIIINTSYFPLIKSLREGNLKLPIISKFKFIINIFSNLILNSFNDNRKNKRKTFKIWEPSEQKNATGIIEKFVLHQAKLKEIILDSQDLISKGAIIHSPANKNIVYKLETAFDIIVAQEKRHYEQANEL